MDMEIFHRTCNPEMYFKAENRIKYATVKKGPKVMNDMKKGKTAKPRKGQRGTGGREKTLPQKPTFKFSVTQEATKVANQDVMEFDTSKHPAECEALLKGLESDYPRWICLLKEGFNIMLYGYGSKLPVFQSFKEFLNEDFLTVSVNGLYPKLNARKFLVELCKALGLKTTFVGSNLEILSEAVYDSLKNVEKSDVFLLVKNFDMLAVHHPTMLTALSSLSKVSFIHIVASCDHINAFLGVNQTQTIEFNFAWVDSTTFFPYDEELTWKPEVFGSDRQTDNDKNALEHVMKSLTANARKAFSILATLQLSKVKAMDKSKIKEFQGVEFRELARKCREAFIAHSDPALKTLLVEFIDHKLIRSSGKTKASNNFLIIELDNDTLEKVINV